MKIVSRLAALAMLIIMIQSEIAHSGKLTITWHYFHSEIASWRAVGENMWGGIDRSCTGVLNGCAKYDWMTTYNYSVQAPNLPPAAVSPDYPTEPRIAIMIQDGQTPPSTLPTPEVTQTFEN